MADDADEEDHFAGADIEGEDRLDIAAEDHPDRACCGDDKAGQNAGPRSLAEHRQGETGAHPRHQCEDLSLIHI